MKKKVFIILVSFMLFAMAACGRQENRNIAGIEGIIEDQSFDVELDGWGNVKFASISPLVDTEIPSFVLLKDERVVYNFPMTNKSGTASFVKISAVSFLDYNMDEKKDIIVLIQYGDGASTWNEAQIFLQENSDNMFYLDYPSLESYKKVTTAKEGPAFYKDTMLEEYLSSQKWTESVSDMKGSWPEYIEYIEGLYGNFSIEKQIELFSKQKDIWAEDIEYADERYCFALVDLDYDGRMELIISNYGGTGHYTYSRFYKIDERGIIKELETNFTEGNSQPDIMDEDQITLYSGFSTEGIRDYYIVYDQLKEAPYRYVYRVSSIYLNEDMVMEIPLAIQTVLYEGEDFSANVTSKDSDGNTLTEEEYENYAESYYRNMGLTKNTATFGWTEVNGLKGMSDAEVAKVLMESYEQFSRN